jgi:hypothetical protein
MVGSGFGYTVIPLTHWLRGSGSSSRIYGSAVLIKKSRGPRTKNSTRAYKEDFLISTFHMRIQRGTTAT